MKGRMAWYHCVDGFAVGLMALVFGRPTALRTLITMMGHHCCADKLEDGRRKTENRISCLLTAEWWLASIFIPIPTHVKDLIWWLQARMSNHLNERQGLCLNGKVLAGVRMEGNDAKPSRRFKWIDGKNITRSSLTLTKACLCWKTSFQDEKCIASIVYHSVWWIELHSSFILAQGYALRQQSMQWWSRVSASCWRWRGLFRLFFFKFRTQECSWVYNCM